MTITAVANDRIEALHTAHSASLLRFLIRLTHGEQQTAEDLAQETMVRAWRHADRLPDDFAAERRWLFTVARNLVIDLFRARKSRPPETPVLDLGWISTAADTPEAAIATQSILTAFQRLSEAQRGVLIDLHLRGEQPQAVADKLRIPVGTVKSRAHYALRALRQEMEATV
ncbi:sigma-70 family RNA polymerase sigma factor [Actinoplanes couchii]|uniref:RNA polymerase sigma factor SigL n=1 Tax=Actinoplanes couchii TaxID=403638 RepID=A0ABQ3XD58_9ACTN|nr:sigma-70 family RNA polymerase sigma factor [Actinoplanes couchii]MDR6321326.1 RNA polymerase sigma-70 factor (ECF subfamily) [Actinoplanes couchii]GID56436.1 RNA polymerase sigma factor SigL [Actinoplanes couchii]